jgi:hypothetical protein
MTAYLCHDLVWISSGWVLLQVCCCPSCKQRSRMRVADIAGRVLHGHSSTPDIAFIDVYVTHACMASTAHGNHTHLHESSQPRTHSVPCLACVACWLCCPNCSATCLRNACTNKQWTLRLFGSHYYNSLKQGHNSPHKLLLHPSRH